MTRIFTDGAEAGDTAVFAVVGASFTNTATNPSSGSRCYRSTANPASQINVASASEYYFRARISPDTLPSGGFHIVTWRNGATTLGSIFVNSGNQLLVTVTGSTGSQAPANITVAQYALYEAHIKIANSGGKIEALIDNNPIFSFTGDTQPAALTTIDNFQIGNTTTGLASIYIDDLAINDTAGLIDNSWCGDGHILAMLPNAVGDVTELSRGGTDTGANWSQVNEIPPNNDTTYVYSTGSGQYDLYNLSSGSLLVSPTDTITRVYVEGRIRETSATGDSIQLGIKSSGSENWSSNLPVTTAYARYLGTQMLINPVTGLNWTIADLDALQVGYKVI